MPSWLEGSAGTAGAVLLVVATAGATCTAVTASPSPDNLQPSSETVHEAPQLLPHCLELIRAGRTEEARELLAPAAERRPDWAEAQALLGFTYFNEKRWEAAKTLYERALAIDPDLHATRVPYAWCLYYLGRLNEAREQFLAYLEIDPDYPDAVFALGLIQFDTDDLEPAEHQFRRVIILARARRDVAREALAHTRLADIHMRTGNLQRAKHELVRSIGLDPSNPKAYFKLSRALQLLGDTEGAAAARTTYEELRGASDSPADRPVPSRRP